MNKLALPPRLRLPLLALLAAGLLFLLFFWKKSPGPLQAVPSQSALVVQLDGLAQAGQLIANLPDPAWKNVLQNTVLRACWQDAGAAERLFRHHEPTHAAFANGTLVAALSFNQADSLHPLFILDLGAKTDLEAVLKTNPVTQKFFPSNFHGRILYTVHLSKRDRLVVTRIGRLLLFSRFSYLVEDGVAQLERGDNWWAGQGWNRQIDPAAPLKIYLRPSALEGPAANRLDANWRALPGLLTRNVACLGFSWDGDNLVGAARADGFLAKMTQWGETPARNIYTVLPDNSVALALSGFSRHNAFFEGFSAANDDDFQKFVLPWVGQEAAFAVTEPYSATLTDEQFIVLAVRDSALAQARLQAYGDQRGLLRRYDYQTFEIAQFLSQSILAPLAGADNPAFRNPACATVGNYIVFGGSSAALELWIDKYIVNETLSNMPDFLAQQQKTGASGPASFLLNTAYLPAILKKIAKPEAAAANAGEVQLFMQTGFVGLEMRPGRHTGWLSVEAASQSASSRPRPMATSSILWKTPLAAPAAAAPSIVAPLGEGEALVFVQDTRNELYCLRANGAVAWRRQLDARILSRVQGIDFQNNGTACFLFNTADHIWLLDAEGHDMDGFPLKLQSPAVNGLTVVDFDENRQYSFFIASANGNVYGYDQFARPLPGWNPQSGVGQVKQPILHFQRQDKDYLVALSGSGRLSVFGRNGAARFPALQLEGKFNGPPQVDAASKAPRIVCANKAGRVFVCALDGSTFSLSAGKTDKAAAYFVFSPLTGDERYDYSWLTDKRLITKTYAGGVLKNAFEYAFPIAPDTLFAAAGSRLGALNREKRQVFLLDAQGKLHPDFPLAGDTPFVMDALLPNRTEQILVVGNGASIYAYKIR